MVHPATVEVVWSDESCKLEPRVMQVLIALNRRRGAPLSREELSQLCWNGRVVGTDALVRCIVKLSKIFQRDPAVEIVGIPKVGYGLPLDNFTMFDGEPQTATSSEFAVMVRSRPGWPFPISEGPEHGR